MVNESRRRVIGHVLVFGITLPAVVAVLVLGFAAMSQPRLTYWIVPVMLLGLLAAHAARRVKAPVRT